MSKNIVENWIDSNSKRLGEISAKNQPLYNSIFEALLYLNKYVGGEEITLKIPEPKSVWRVKTEAEVIEEFGDKWRNELGWTNSTAMDFLLGQKISDVFTEDTVEVFLNDNGYDYDSLEAKDGGYTVLYKAITNKPLPVASTTIKFEETKIRTYNTDYTANFLKYIFLNNICPLPSNLQTIDDAVAKYSSYRYWYITLDNNIGFFPNQTSFNESVFDELNLVKLGVILPFVRYSHEEMERKKIQVNSFQEGKELVEMLYQCEFWGKKPNEVMFNPFYVDFTNRGKDLIALDKYFYLSDYEGDPYIVYTDDSEYTFQNSSFEEISFKSFKEIFKKKLQEQHPTTYEETYESKFKVGDFVQTDFLSGLTKPVYEIKIIFGSVAEVTNADGGKKQDYTFAIDDLILFEQQPKYKVNDIVSTLVYSGAERYKVLDAKWNSFAKKFDYDLTSIDGTVNTVKYEDEIQYAVTTDEPETTTQADQPKFKVGDIIEWKADKQGFVVRKGARALVKGYKRSGAFGYQFVDVSWLNTPENDLLTKFQRDGEYEQEDFILVTETAKTVPNPRTTKTDTRPQPKFKRLDYVTRIPDDSLIYQIDEVEWDGKQYLYKIVDLSEPDLERRVEENYIELYNQIPRLKTDDFEVGDWVRLIDTKFGVDTLKLTYGDIGEVVRFDDLGDPYIVWLKDTLQSDNGYFTKSRFELAYKQPKPLFKRGDIVEWKQTIRRYSVEKGAKAEVLGYDVIDGEVYVIVFWLNDPENLELVKGQASGGYGEEDFKLVTATPQAVSKPRTTKGVGATGKKPIAPKKVDKNLITLPKDDSSQTKTDDIDVNDLLDDLENLEF